MSDSPELINAFAPTVPMWAVFCDLDTGELETSPIVALALIRDPADKAVMLHPLSFGSDYIDQAWDLPSQNTNFVGYSLTVNPSKESFAKEIERVIKNRGLSEKKISQRSLTQEKSLPVLGESKPIIVEITEGVAVVKIDLGGSKTIQVEVDGNRISIFR